ncbi:hypothetical protein ELG97_37125 [Rhizobium leguminosarum]|uniref:hypothetical protein n=1 Tax=Rhizobium leguminosarum TaxID=384 RepID=UPI0010315BFC|nr:hypothetical protein [Rhizobium leguminosarum]TBE73854.1 hypothetical protein ELG97_37125 [Rhizobium leguminosarum]
MSEFQDFDPDAVGFEVEMRKVTATVYRYQFPENTNPDRGGHTPDRRGRAWLHYKAPYENDLFAFEPGVENDEIGPLLADLAIHITRMNPMVQIMIGPKLFKKGADGSRTQIPGRGFQLIEYCGLAGKVIRKPIIALSSEISREEAFKIAKLAAFSLFVTEATKPHVYGRNYLAPYAASIRASETAIGRGAPKEDDLELVLTRWMDISDVFLEQKFPTRAEGHPLHFNLFYDFYCGFTGRDKDGDGASKLKGEHDGSLNPNLPRSPAYQIADYFFDQLDWMRNVRRLRAA